MVCQNGWSMYCSDRKKAQRKLVKMLFSSSFVVQLFSHVPLCDPMDCSMPGSPVLHYLPKCAQIHIHQVGDASVSSSATRFSFAFNLSQHQRLFQ